MRKKNIAKVLILLGSLGLVNCQKSVPEQESTPSVPVSTAPQQVVEESKHPGLLSIEKSDCASCHHIDKKIIGPSYREISQKYSPNDADQLAEKIINGSVGNWGSVPMAPHPSLTKEEAKIMALYILSLKNS